MAVSEKKRITNDRYNAKCDVIVVKPLKPVGERIRNAAAKSGRSLQGYILDAVDHQISIDEDGENVPANVIVNLMDWLGKHGHSDEEITECIAAICKTEE